MNQQYLVTFEDGRMELVTADSCKFIREKGGNCRYELSNGNEKVAFINATAVKAIIKQ